MEKYSKFSDASTGISPFKLNKPVSAQYNIAIKVAIYLLTVVCVPLALLVLSIYSCLQFILPYFLQKILINYVVLSFFRLFYSSFLYDGEKRVSVRKSSLKKAQNGDVLLSNFVSPLDPLVYLANKSCLFAVPAEDGKFVELGLWSCIKFALKVQKFTTGVKLNDISLRAKASGAILVVFVEGTTSNGRGVLSLLGFDPQEYEIEGNVYASAIKYSPACAHAPTPKSLFGYIYGVSTSAFWYMASIKVSGQPIKKGSIHREEVSKQIAALGRLRILGEKMNIDTKIEYIKAYST